MAVLHFNPAKLPRTMTRAEWEACWRWKRECERKLKEQLELDLQMLREGKIPAHMREDFLDRIINPPIILGTPF